jgi:hypothetical protein
MPVQVAKGNDNGQHKLLKKHKYKPTLRKAPYAVSLVFLIIATVLTVLNIYVSPHLVIGGVLMEGARFNPHYRQVTWSTGI